MIEMTLISEIDSQVQLALCIPEFHIHVFNQAQIENTWGKKQLKIKNTV